MKQLYNFRLDPTLVKQIDSMGDTRTSHVVAALQMYTQSFYDTNYNTSMVDLLKDQIMDLKNDKTYLQNQVSGLMLAKVPLLTRVMLKIKNSD